MKLLLNYSASRCFIANFSVSCSLQGSGDWLLACGPVRCGTAEWDDAVYYRSTLDKGLRLTLRSVQIWVNSVSDGEHLNTRQTEAHNTHWYQCNIITCCGVHQQSSNKHHSWCCTICHGILFRVQEYTASLNISASLLSSNTVAWQHHYTGVILPRNFSNYFFILGLQFYSALAFRHFPFFVIFILDKTQDLLLKTNHKPRSRSFLWWLKFSSGLFMISYIVI